MLGEEEDVEEVEGEAATARAGGKESMEEVLRRHKREVREHETAARQLVKKANKNKAKVAVAEAEALRLRYAMEARHREELEQVEQEGCEGSQENSRTLLDGDAAAAAAEAKKLEQEAEAERERAAAKKAKAQRKKNRTQQKEAERAQRIAEERAASGPDARAVELEALMKVLDPKGLRVQEVQSDGHCLYRSVSLGLGEGENSFANVRSLVASHLRTHIADFMPFTESSNEEEYEQYCSNVECSAEWGGDLEVRALSQALRRPVEVYRAYEGLLVFGEEEGGSPLRLSYHKDFYALGEHYNAVV